MKQVAMLLSKWNILGDIILLFIGFSLKENFSIFIHNPLKTFYKNSALNKPIFVKEIIPSVIFQSNPPNGRQ